MRIFKNTWFHRFARREKISDETLLEAIEKAEKGIIDKSEIEAFKKLAKELLTLSDKHIQELVDNGGLTEIEQ